MSQNDFDLARFNYQNYRYCYDNGHQQFLVKALRCFEFWRGNQWTDADVRRLNAAGRPALTINTIESLVRALRGMQMALRNDVRFAPTQSIDDSGAQVRDALWLDTQNRNKLNFTESDNYLRGIIMSRAFYDVRVDFSESMQGNVSIREKRPQDVILDPMFLSYDPADWPQVYDHCWENLLDLEYLYGRDKAEAVKGSQDPSYFDIDDTAQSREFGQLPYYYAGWADTEIDSKLVRAFKVISRQYSVLKRKDCFIDTVTGDFSEIPETWARERVQKVLDTYPDVTTLRRDVKTVRWTVTCNDVVLHDEDSPYKWFTIVPFFPTMLDGTCIGLVESLIDPQQLYNKVTSQELHIINTTANSGWKTVKGNIKNYSPEQLERGGAATGIVLEVENIENTQKIEPNQVPQGHERMSMKADTIMRQLGGVSKSGMGFAREDVSGDAIERNNAAQDINSVGWLENLYRSRQLLAERSQDCWEAYYTEARVITINRGSPYKPDYQQVGINQVTDEGMVVNDVTQGRYTTTLVPAPTRTTMSESDFKLLANLRSQGILNIPDDVLIEMLPVSNKTSLMQRLKGDSNDDAAQAKQVELQNAIKTGQLTDAQLAKTNADAQLSTARANKANAEAADPAAADAAYERVEMARIGSDHQLETARLEQQGAKDALQHRQAQQKTAVELTKIESTNANHRQKMMVDLATKASKPPAAPKAPAAKKKPAGKKTQTRKRA